MRRRQVAHINTRKTLDAASLSEIGIARIEHGGAAVALVVEQVLPLLDHALEVVVEHQHLHPHLVLGRRQLPSKG